MDKHIHSNGQNRGIALRRSSFNDYRNQECKEAKNEIILSLGLSDVPSCDILLLVGKKQADYVVTVFVGVKREYSTVHRNRRKLRWF